MWLQESEGKTGANTWYVRAVDIERLEPRLAMFFHNEKNSAPPFPSDYGRIGNGLTEKKHQNRRHRPLPLLVHFGGWIAGVCEIWNDFERAEEPHDSSSIGQLRGCCCRSCYSQHNCCCHYLCIFADVTRIARDGVKVAAKLETRPVAFHRTLPQLLCWR